VCDLSAAILCATLHLGFLYLEMLRPDASGGGRIELLALALQAGDEFVLINFNLYVYKL
jgi:hypothetical protein